MENLISAVENPTWTKIHGGIVLEQSFRGETDPADKVRGGKQNLRGEKHPAEIFRGGNQNFRGETRPANEVRGEKHNLRGEKHHAEISTVEVTFSAVKLTVRTESAEEK